LLVILIVEFASGGEGAKKHDNEYSLGGIAGWLIRTAPPEKIK